MPGHGYTFAEELLLLIFNGEGISNIADNAVSSPLTNLYVSLHTADPTSNSDQEEHECTYTSYARVAVARNSGGWTITNNVVAPVADIVFPTCSGGSEVAKFFMIGTHSTGGGNNLYYGGFSPSISISSGITPRIKSSSTLQEN